MNNRRGLAAMAIIAASLCASPIQAQIQVAVPAFAFGYRGSGPGEFNEPRGVGIAPNGNIYVSDALNYRVQIFTPDGIYLDAFGSQGAAPGAVDAPLDLAVHSDGNVFVLDTSNHRVQKFDSEGAFIKAWGGMGSAQGKFNLPRCLALDRAGNVYVTDGYNNRVQKFTGDGQFLLSFGGVGSTDGKMRVPVGIAVDNENNVYVADQTNYRIQKFTSEGQFITKWGSKGSKPGQFENSPGADGGPNGMTVDPAGNLVVTDGGNNRVQIFSSSGQFITQFGQAGSELGDLSLPARTDFSPDNSVLYITEVGNVRIQAFNYTVPPPMILSFKPGGSTVTMTWSAISGRRYQLQSQSDIGGSWKNLGEPISVANYPGSTTIALETTPSRFFRLALLPQQEG